MGKRKQEYSSEEEDEAIATQSGSEESEKPTKSKAKAKARELPKRKSVKKPTLPSDDEDEEEERSVKKKKVEKPLSSNGEEASSSVIRKDLASGDKYIDLGKKRRATVRGFKGAVYLDIREFYEAAGEEKPGKKGISLSAEQWEVLKNHAETIDTLFKKAKK